MRASFVFEKFTEDSDPVHDMGIGLIHDFNSSVEMHNWLADNLHIILGSETIPDNIINEQGYYIRYEYYTKIKEFYRKYLSVNGKKEGNLWPEYLRNMLEERGFKTHR